jgi:hypothetical protein
MRNIIFVIQKNYDNEGKKIYEILRVKYLINQKFKWLINRRNATVKETPSDITKVLKVTYMM